MKSCMKSLNQWYLRFFKKVKFEITLLLLTSLFIFDIRIVGPLEEGSILNAFFEPAMVGRLL